jgi:two-component system NtrC family response regulator
MANVLIIDDDPGICRLFSSVIGRLGHDVSWSQTLRGGYEQAMAGSYDVVFLDVLMPDGNGLDLLSGIRDASSRPEVIVMTSRGNPDGAELAIRNGAWHYIDKPSSLEQITLPLVQALQYREEKKASRRFVELKREGIIGESPKMRACIDLLAKAGGSDANALIMGETGTGKELFARAIHENSSRSKNSFVVVDCTILPETLVESMLLGHERGSFTGADRTQIGLISQADGGTLFLDEVGELPWSVQKVFLRVLEERRFRPLGGKQEVESDFRLVCATNRDLEDMVRNGDFRSDLLFRLRGITLDLPPLRERTEDIQPLARHHMTKICERYGLAQKNFSPDFFDVLDSYDWPGNVRELCHTLERTISLAVQEPTLFPNHLPNHIRIHVTRSSVGDKSTRSRGFHAADAQAGPPPLPTIRDVREAALAEAEEKYLRSLLACTGGSMSDARRISGLSRARLYALLRKYGLSGEGRLRASA